MKCMPRLEIEFRFIDIKYTFLKNTMKVFQEESGAVVSVAVEWLLILLHFDFLVYFVPFTFDFLLSSKATS